MNCLDIIETFIPPLLRGQGIASLFVKYVFYYVRKQQEQEYTKVSNVKFWYIKGTCTFISETFIPKYLEEIKYYRINKNKARKYIEVAPLPY